MRSQQKSPEQDGTVTVNEEGKEKKLCVCVCVSLPLKFPINTVLTDCRGTSMYFKQSDADSAGSAWEYSWVDGTWSLLCPAADKDTVSISQLKADRAFILTVMMSYTAMWPAG